MTTALPHSIWIVAAFLVGACVGSFLNVVIDRVPRGRSIAWPGSHCSSCGHAIRPWHNVPIVSWFALRGRCRDCRARFSIRHALVELSFALVCAAAALRHGPGLAALEVCVLVALLIALSAIDLDTWLLPHAVTWPGIALGLLLAVPLGPAAFLNRLLAAAVGYTALLIVGFLGERALGKTALGGGDLFLFALIGAFLGTRALLPVLFLASLQGSLVGVAMIVRRRRLAQAAPSAPSPVPPTRDGQTAWLPAQKPGDGWKPDETAFPFGPFLALGAVEVLASASWFGVGPSVPGFW